MGLHAGGARRAAGRARPELVASALLDGRPGTDPVSAGAEPGVRVQAADLRRSSQSILEAVGTPADLGSIVASSLVDANLAGHDSHGVIRLMSYIAGVRSGQVQPAARAGIESLGGACARVDGAWGWGQPAAHLATDSAADLARANGVGLVTIGRCNHIGRLGEYVEKLSRAGLIGLMTCNARSAVAPYGGFTTTCGANTVPPAGRREERPPPPRGRSAPCPAAPVEREWRSRGRRTEEGIPVPDATNRAIIELAAELGAEFS